VRVALFLGVTLGRPEAFDRIISAKEPKKLPVVLSGEEIVRFLQAVPGLRNRAALTTAYRAGLRVCEVAALKIGDIDSSRMVTIRRGAGGAKDGDQGEREPAKHAPGAGPGKRVTSQALERVRQVARQRKKERFTSLLHHVDRAMLRTAFYARTSIAGSRICTRGSKEERTGHYRPVGATFRRKTAASAHLPSLRSRTRFQRATAAVLSAIFEEDFLGFSYGFRPKRSQHDALDALIVGISSRKVNFILDADIRSFFTEVSQQWVVRFLEHRIGDKRVIRLIQKWLRAGVLENGIVTIEEKGTGQGSVISPLLANVYLHYVFDLWAERWRRREATGDMIMVRYAGRPRCGLPA
jgi:hypothetical protein